MKYAKIRFIDIGSTILYNCFTDENIGTFIKTINRSKLTMP